MSPLEKLQRYVAARADAAPELQYIKVAVIRDLTIPTMIQQGISTFAKKNDKSGAVLSVFQPLLMVPHPNASGPITVGRITLRAQENPKFNNTGMTAEEIAIFALSFFQGWSPAFLGALRPSKDAVKPSLDYDPLVTYDATLEFDLGLEQTAKAAAPTIGLGANVTLASSLAGAAIYYTLDGTLPAPANGDVAANGTLYTVPFASPASGTLITAVAYKSGTHWGSNVTEETIS